MGFFDLDTIQVPVHGEDVEAAWARAVNENMAAIWDGVAQSWKGFDALSTFIDSPGDLLAEGYYHQLGFSTTVTFATTIGSTTTFDASGAAGFPLPIPPRDEYAIIGTCYAFDTSANSGDGEWYGGAVVTVPGTDNAWCVFGGQPTTTGYATKSNPFIFAAGDILAGQVFYESAKAPTGLLTGWPHGEGLWGAGVTVGTAAAGSRSAAGSGDSSATVGTTAEGTPTFSDTTPPVVTWGGVFASTTTVGAQIGQTLDVAGTATDDETVFTVELEIRRADTGQYWNNVAWVLGYIVAPAVFTDPAWTYTLPAIPDTVVTITAVGVDTSGNRSAGNAVTVTGVNPAGATTVTVGTAATASTPGSVTRYGRSPFPKYINLED